MPIRSSWPVLPAIPNSIGLLVSKTAFEQRGADKMRLHPIGTGPFRFKEYVPRDRVVLVRFDEYWEGKPALDELVIRFMPSSASRELAMRTNEIDSMRGALDAQLLDRLEKQGFVIDKKGPETVWYLHINTSVAPLNDIRVRKAIAHAINPADLRTFLGPVSTISDVLIPPGYFGAAKAERAAGRRDLGLQPGSCQEAAGRGRAWLRHQAQHDHYAARRLPADDGADAGAPEAGRNQRSSSTWLTTRSITPTS